MLDGSPSTGDLRAGLVPSIVERFLTALCVARLRRALDHIEYIDSKR